MNKSVVTNTRSALGTFVALTLAVALLVYLGLYLLTNGGIVSSTLQTFHDFFAMFKSAEVFMQQFKAGVEKYDRLEQLEGYALLILAAAPLVVLLSRFIRTNQFRFHVQSREVERRALWFFMPVWVLAGVAIFIFAWLVEGGMVTGLLSWMWGAPVVAQAWLVAGGRLLLALLSVAVILGVLVAGVAWTAARQRGVRVGWMARRLLRLALFVPGLRQRVALASIRRVEIQATGEGPRALVLRLTGGGCWTVSQGRQRHLERLGGVVARMAGLARRDCITWG